MHLCIVLKFCLCKITMAPMGTHNASLSLFQVTDLVFYCSTSLDIKVGSWVVLGLAYSSNTQLLHDNTKLAEFGKSEG